MQESWLDKSKASAEKKTMRHYFLESTWVALRRPAALLLPIFAIVQSQHTAMHFLEAAVVHQHHHHMMRKWLGELMPLHHELSSCMLLLSAAADQHTTNVRHANGCKLQAPRTI